MDPVIGGELNRYGRNQGDVHGDRAQLLKDVLEALAGEIGHAKQHLVEFTATSEIEHRVESPDHFKAVDLLHFGPVVGHADEADMGQPEIVDDAADVRK